MERYQEVMVALSESVIKKSPETPPTAGGDCGQSLFAYNPILSTLSYNFKTVVHFLDEGKL